MLRRIEKGLNNERRKSQVANATGQAPFPISSSRTSADFNFAANSDGTMDPSLNKNGPVNGRGPNNMTLNATTPTATEPTPVSPLPTCRAGPGPYSSKRAHWPITLWTAMIPMIPMTESHWTADHSLPAYSLVRIVATHSGSALPRPNPTAAPRHDR
ncbi:hypothetical protein FRC12_017562 [Ceratobasidium sp. 428]|nr:hypothetical protein FRC12_017562 [Ceratobasidium sp. 428]